MNDLEVRNELTAASLCSFPVLIFPWSCFSHSISLFSSSVVSIFVRCLIKTHSRASDHKWAIIITDSLSHNEHLDRRDLEINEQIAHNSWKQTGGFFLPKKYRIFYSGQVLCGLEPADVT